MRQIVPGDPAPRLTQINRASLPVPHHEASMEAPHMTAQITPDLLRKYDVSGPRYTSYPTADRVVEAFGPSDYMQALAQRREGPSVLATPLSGATVGRT